MTEEIFQIGVKALIIRDGRILLLKSGPAENKFTGFDFWDVPGGRIQVDHGIKDTLKREIEEELGVSGGDIIIGEIFDAAISNFKKHHSTGTKLMLIAYKCEIKNNKNFILSDEHSEYAWFEPKEAAEVLSQKFPKSFTDKIGELYRNNAQG